MYQAADDESLALVVPQKFESFNIYQSMGCQPQHQFEQQHSDSLRKLQSNLDNQHGVSSIHLPFHRPPQQRQINLSSGSSLPKQPKQSSQQLRLQHQTSGASLRAEQNQQQQMNGEQDYQQKSREQSSVNNTGMKLKASQRNLQQQHRHLLNHSRQQQLGSKNFTGNINNRAASASNNQNKSNKTQQTQQYSSHPHQKMMNKTNRSSLSGTIASSLCNTTCVVTPSQTQSIQ